LPFSPVGEVNILGFPKILRRDIDPAEKAFSAAIRLLYVVVG
jgi:hypothetical protein